MVSLFARSSIAIGGRARGTEVGGNSFQCGSHDGRRSGSQFRSRGGRLNWREDWSIAKEPGDELATGFGVDSEQVEEENEVEMKKLVFGL